MYTQKDPTSAPAISVAELAKHSRFFSRRLMDVFIL